MNDIISTQYPFPLRHERMRTEDRAAQFSAFKALTGYESEIEEAARVTDAKADRDEHAVEELDHKLRIIREKIDEQPRIRIRYFVPDPRKKGGKYVTVCEKVRKIDEYAKTIQFTNGLAVPIDDIYAIEGDIFE